MRKPGRKQPAVTGQADIDAAAVHAWGGVRQATITGLVALLAALVATGGTLVATHLTLDDQSEREDKRVDTQTKGAARMLSSELITTANYMMVLAHDRLYRPFDTGYPIDMPPEDMRLVFSKLTPNEWGTVILALSSVQGLETFVRAKRSDGVRRLGRRAVNLVTADLQNVVAATETLQRVGEVEDLDLPVGATDGKKMILPETSPPGN